MLFGQICLKKSANDTNILFSSKLRGLLLQYLHERKVTKFDELVSLFVSDRIKSSLTDQCLKYVLSIENNLPIDTQQWLDPQRLTEIVDEHVSYVGLASTRASYIGQQTRNGEGRYQSHWQNKFDGAESGGANSHKCDRHKPQQQGESQGRNHFGRRCTICQSTSHYKSECDKFKDKGKWPPKHVAATSVKSHIHGNTAAVNKPASSQHDRSAAHGAQAALGDPHVSVCKVALDRDSSVGLVTSSASGVIGLPHQSVQRVYSGESGTACMNRSVCRLTVF